MKTRRIADAMDLTDLDIISLHFGHEHSPYPLMVRWPRPFKDSDDYAQYARMVPQRLMEGDLASHNEWLQIFLVNPDIRVACAIGSSHLAATTRIAAARSGHLGCIVQQNSTEDTVTVDLVPALEIGSELVKRLPLRHPGKQTRVLIPGMSIDGDDEVACGTISDPQPRQPMLPVLARREIIGDGIAQSDWRPPQRWGTSRKKYLIKWIHSTDGDYIVSMEGTHAVPMTRDLLRERIDRSIAEDAAELRRLRGTALA